MNNSTPTPAIPRCYDMWDVFTALFIVLLTVTSVFGNVLVILAVATYHRMRTFTNWLLLSLATADCLVGAVIMPPAMMFQLQTEWTFGIVFCRIWATLDTFLCTASIWNLCAISIDRYFAISYPLKYMRYRQNSLVFLLIIGVWVVSLVVCVPPWIVPTWGFTGQESDCGYVKTLPYRIYSSGMSFYIPLFIMCAVYYRVLKVADARNDTETKNGTMTLTKHVTVRKSTPYPPIVKDNRTNSLHCGQNSRIMTGGRSKTNACAPHRRSISGSVPSELETLRFQMESCSENNNVSSTRRRSSLGKDLAVNDVSTTDFLVPKQRNMRTEVLMKHTRNNRSGAKSSRSVHMMEEVVEEGEVQLHRSPNCIIANSTTDEISSSMDVSITNDPFPTLTKNAKKWYQRSTPISLMTQAQSYYKKTKPVKSRREKNIFMREKKAMKTVGLIVVGFIFSWFPFFVIYVLDSACESCEKLIPNIVRSIFLWLGYSNSCLNPIIYTFYNQDFRRCFRDLLTCGCFKAKVNRRMSVRMMLNRTHI